MDSDEENVIEEDFYSFLNIPREVTYKFQWAYIKQYKD